MIWKKSFYETKEKLKNFDEPCRPGDPKEITNEYNKVVTLTDKH